MSNFSKEIKKIDLEFKKYCEETLKITREDFNDKFSELLEITPDSSLIETLEAGHFINRLWHYLKGDD